MIANAEECGSHPRPTPGVLVVEAKEKEKQEVSCFRKKKKNPVPREKVKLGATSFRKENKKEPFGSHNSLRSVQTQF